MTNSHNIQNGVWPTHAEKLRLGRHKAGYSFFVVAALVLVRCGGSSAGVES